MSNPNTLDRSSIRGQMSMEARQRKRMQNRLAQRTYRQRVKRRMEDLERWRDMALAITSTVDEVDGTPCSSASCTQPHVMPSRQALPTSAPLPQSLPSPISPPMPPPPTSHEARALSSPEKNGPPSGIDSLFCMAWNPTLNGSATHLNDISLDHTEDSNDHLDHRNSPGACSSRKDTELSGLPFPDSHPQDTFNDISLPPEPSREITSASKASSSSSSSSFSSCSSSPSKNCGKTALHLAAERDQRNIIRFLLQQMIDPNLQDAQGRTPLHLAVENNHNNAVSMLLGHSHFATETADSRNLVANTSSSNVTPIKHTGQLGHTGGMSMDVGVGAMGAQNRPMVVNINIQDHEGRAPLHVAVIAGHQAIVEMLLQTSLVDVELKDRQGRTPLHEAIVAGHDDIFRALVDKGADINVRVG